MSPVMSETEIDYLKFSQPFFTLKNNENIEQINNTKKPRKCCSFAVSSMIFYTREEPKMQYYP